MKHKIIKKIFVIAFVISIVFNIYWTYKIIEVKSLSKQIGESFNDTWSQQVSK